MRKWSPEAFTATIDRSPPVFEEWTDRADRKARPDDFLNAFASEEETVHQDPAEEIRLDLQEQFNQRSARMQDEYTRRLAEARQEFSDSLTAWRDSWNDLQERRMRRLAEDATEMAVMMAEKIIRQRANHDQDMLLRSLETALFKIQAESEVTVRVHPDDVFWLEMDEETRRRLRIGPVVADRRVDRGGCRIKSDGQEWDATVKSQLASLAELLKDALVDTDIPGDPHDDD